MLALLGIACQNCMTIGTAMTSLPSEDTSGVVHINCRNTYKRAHASYWRVRAYILGSGRQKLQCYGLWRKSDVQASKSLSNKCTLWDESANAPYSCAHTFKTNSADGNEQKRFRRLGSKPYHTTPEILRPSLRGKENNTCGRSVLPSFNSSSSNVTDIACQLRKETSIKAQFAADKSFLL